MEEAPPTHALQPAPERAQKEAVCETCQQPFAYIPASRKPRRVCPACQRKVFEKCVREARQRKRLATTEARAQNLDGLRGVALRSQDEVALILFVTRQAITDTERSALYKLRSNDELRRIREDPEQMECARGEETPRRREPLDFSYSEIEQALRGWRALLTDMQADENCAEEAAAMSLELEQFEALLKPALHAARCGRK